MDEAREWVRAWKPRVAGVHEVFHARFVDHAYPQHTHDSWTVFVVDDGAIRYDLEARHRGVAEGRVTILPPHLVHDGRASGTGGYRKRVIYLDADVLDERLIGPAVDRPDVEDHEIVRDVGALHVALQAPEDTLRAESLLAVVAATLGRHLGARPEDPGRPDVALAADLRDLLDLHRSGSLRLAEAGRILHASPAHLVRCFTAAFGIPPHRYLVGRRIEAARWRLLDGESAAQVAVAVGFHDQAHLTRHFRRHVGTTPARYARSRPPHR